jgi:hypothetical protein
MLPTSAFEQRRHRDDVRPFGFDDDFAGSGRLEWWARQGSNQFLAQKVTLPICQRSSCVRRDFCDIRLKLFSFIAPTTF